MSDFKTILESGLESEVEEEVEEEVVEVGLREKRGLSLLNIL